MDSFRRGLIFEFSTFDIISYIIGAFWERKSHEGLGGNYPIVNVNRHFQKMSDQKEPF